MDAKALSAFANIQNVIECEIEKLEESHLADQCIAIELQSDLDTLIDFFKQRRDE